MEIERMVETMSEYNNYNVYEASGESLKSYINKVFIKMGIALLITTAVAYFGYRSLFTGGILAKFVMGSSFAFIGLMIVQIAVVLVLSLGLRKLSPTAANILFYVYSAITGVTFSVLPLAFEISTIFTAFLFAAVLFGSCAVIGYTTNVDLSRFRGLMLGGLLALVITSVLSIFIPILRNNILISYLGLAIFLALTAWDMQKIRAYYYSTETSPQMRANLSTYAALDLYLDFINIFLRVLQILGRNSKN
ncbi:MAG: Bax inhibitor-1/YccA family protein [Solobacterium sp.]|nr:Bax inhibitor-1/YccA family protein [Solobacterium sp.]